MIAVHDANAQSGFRSPRVKVLKPLAGLAVSGASTGYGRAPAPGATPRAGSGRASERLRSLLQPRAPPQRPGLHRSGAGAGARARCSMSRTYLCSPRTDVSASSTAAYTAHQRALRESGPSPALRPRPSSSGSTRPRNRRVRMPQERRAPHGYHQTAWAGHSTKTASRSLRDPRHLLSRYVVGCH